MKIQIFHLKYNNILPTKRFRHYIRVKLLKYNINCDKWLLKLFSYVVYFVCELSYKFTEVFFFLLVLIAYFVIKEVLIKIS